MRPWQLLITTLPTENATVRMRAWRSLKASGAAVLRDGVYLMPEGERGRGVMEEVAAEVREGGGMALVLAVQEPEGVDFAGLFDRGAEFGALLADISKAQDTLAPATVQEVLKQARKLRKAFDNLAHIDFFPGEAQRQTSAALEDLERTAVYLLAPDEPRAVEGELPRRPLSDYQGRVWATRRRPWVDRLASAWLIRRFIDPDARLLWLSSPGDCPPEALGFDFDGATFSHVGGRVTFEVLLASFGLERPALKRMGGLVHFLDVGGVQPPEAPGVESVLAGLSAATADDDQLLKCASPVFDGLLAAFENGTTTK